MPVKETKACVLSFWRYLNLTYFRKRFAVILKLSVVQHQQIIALAWFSGTVNY